MQAVQLQVKFEKGKKIELLMLKRVKMIKSTSQPIWTPQNLSRDLVSVNSYEPQNLRRDLVSAWDWAD